MSKSSGQYKKVEFWFDFASGYAYFAAHDLMDLVKRQDFQIVWRPFMLGSAFNVTGARGLSSTPLKAEYARHDWQRLARLKGLPFELHAQHPSVTLPAMRAFYWIEMRAPDLAGRYALTALKAYFQDQKDLGQIDTVVEIVTGFGFEPGNVNRGLSDPSIKSLARQMSEEAISRGVFGSPFFFIEDEPFWGWDRIPLMEEWLSEGGW